MKNVTDFCKTVETGVDPRLTVYSKGRPNLRQGRYVVSNCTMGMFSRLFIDLY